MPSPLLVDSAGFRKKLITRNLVPYIKSPYKATPPIDYEVIQSDSSVIDSPDQLIDYPSFANSLYPLNQYGNDGGYVQVPDPNSLNNNKSNEGEYGFQDAHIIDEAAPEAKNWKKVNAYSNGSSQLLDSADFFSSLETINNGDRLYNNQPYPTTFNPSSYNPVSILLTRDPLGSNGSLSSDSFLARLGANRLRADFQDRIGREIARNTVARANVFNVRSGTDILNLVTGRVPLIEPSYTITVSSNPVIAATDFALRLAGSTIPVSTIPGTYFDASINPGFPTTIQQLTGAFPQANVSNGTGNFFSRLLGQNKTGSQLFLNNTGGGQKSRLFGNIDYNKYKPGYDRTLFDRVGGVVVGSTTNNSNYYVGSITSEPSFIFSPTKSLPIDQFSREIQSPVYGPTELAQLYEGPSQNIKLGANGPTYSDGGGVEGGMTWVSPKYKGNAGKVVGVGGQTGALAPNYRPSSYESTESTNKVFRGGSILDTTQRLINSQPAGGARLKHVGNAIDQVSKVFNDGYKELTKGSRVLSYVGAIGKEVGSEYCRVFAKDIPYLQYNNLQKTDGITTEGRRFSYSVLDKTYNLNIVPNKQEGGQGSTNLIGTTNNAFAKKYMFSIENLAWRTSNTVGYSVSDLAICERGPNGGRVMWFPPYGLTFTESVSANWSQNDFLGRPEPIYTYKNTNRGGVLTWKIVVDHPAALNVIVNKVLKNENNKARIDSIVESFFAGCRKYDIYELAKKYYTVNPNDLFQLQQAITSNELTSEQLVYVANTIQTGVNSDQNQPNRSDTGISDGTTAYFKKYQQLGFYFGNDYPKKDGSIDYDTEYSRYTSTGNQTYYANQSPSTSSQTSQFFSNVVTSNYEVMKQFGDDLAKQLTQNTTGTITITVDSSCSAPATIEYNKQLSARRIASAINWFSNYAPTSKFIKESRLMVVAGTASGETATSQPQKSSTKSGPYSISTMVPSADIVNCTDNDINAKGGDTQSGSHDIFTTSSMSCRRAYIKDINSTIQAPKTTPPPERVSVPVGNIVTTTVTKQNITQEYVNRDNITKRVIRALLSECDYFETIKEDTPMVYDNLKEKLKFFQPAFHSMTPEGLNTRLTFLQQCMRPGDTIPTIKSVNGVNELQYNDAVNTAFGAPPVLVLRVGDFYNTKIIPTSLSLTYENLDINPEGIGIQPMIANVTMNFHFVGGSGLKESIDKLQNALTFNYYANTEIYDDRADVTDDSYKVLDKAFLSSIGNPGPPTINQAQPNNGQTNNSTIGTILTNVVSGTSETGTIAYSEFMTGFVNQTQTYFTTVINKNRESLNQYNNAVRQQWMFERNYTQGLFEVDKGSTVPTVLFGKPNNVEKRFDDIFNELVVNIAAKQEGFIKYISEPQRNFSTRLINTVKDNYVNYVNNKKGVFQSAITKITQDIVNQQQSYVQTLARVNTLPFNSVPNTGTDGFQLKNGNVKVYVISGTSDVSYSSIGVTNTLDELVDDIRTVKRNIFEFNAVIWSPREFIYPGDNIKYSGILVNETTADGQQSGNPIVETKQVFKPFSKNPLYGDDIFRRVYMIVSDDVVDDKKYQTFKTAMIGNVINNSAIMTANGDNNISSVFDSYWNLTAKPAFLNENDITKTFIDDCEKNGLQRFLKYIPFSSKKRVFTYTTENLGTSTNKNDQKQLIENLKPIGNKTTNTNTWNDLVPSDVLISKVKFN